MIKHVTLALGLLTTICSIAATQDARQILESTGAQGGLVVVLGCGNPKLLAEMRAGDSYLVHALDRDPGKVAAARRFLCERGVYGVVTASRWGGKHLPLVDGLVQLLVLADDTAEVTHEEISRVLSPGGIAISSPPARFLPRPFTRPWPNSMDQWSHFLHDASNNAVSTDTVVAPAQGLRWTCGPAYARSHEHLSSVSAMVTAGGRVFYVIDEGPISSVYLPPQWKLVARDAFSGVLLWERPIRNWEAHLRGFRSGPPEIGRRLVATDNHVYVALDYGAPVQVLNAATGTEIATLADTGGARELLLCEETLFVLADDMTAAQHNQRRAAINQAFLRTSPTRSIWQRLQRKAYPMYGRQRIVAISTGAGGYDQLWNRQFKNPGAILPTTMAVDNGKLCFHTFTHVVCLDTADGHELWRHERRLARSRFSWSTPTLAMHDGVVLILDRAAQDNVREPPPDRGGEWIISSGGRDDREDGELVTYALNDGKELWRAPYSENYNTPGDIFVIDDVVWVGNLRGGGDPGFTQGRDLKTGAITRTLPPQKAWGHHRCYRNKATVRWLMVGRGGIQFIEPASGTVKANSWYRGACQYGVMPANGLIYAPQHSCACQPEEMLIGLNALSPLSNGRRARACQCDPRLQALRRGPRSRTADTTGSSRREHAIDDTPSNRMGCQSALCRQVDRADARCPIDRRRASATGRREAGYAGDPVDCLSR